MEDFPEKKSEKGLWVILIIVIVGGYLIIDSFFSDCDPNDYSYGSREYFDCVVEIGQELKEGYNTLEDCEPVAIKTACYKEVAKKTNNLSICGMLENLSYVNELSINSCYSGVGTENNNVEGCERTPGEFDRINCYIAIAKNTGNKDLCENIQHEHYKGQCISQAEA